MPHLHHIEKELTKGVLSLTSVHPANKLSNLTEKYDTSHIHACMCVLYCVSGSHDQCVCLALD